MQWSKLKSRVRDLICPELNRRIDFHLTSYRRSHDGADKVWITIDGVRVFSCKHYTRDWEMYAAFRRGLTLGEAKTHLRQFAIHGPEEFGNAMRAYLELPVREALASEPLIQAFALVDRRVGKRAIERFDLSVAAHPLVRRFYELRRESMVVH